MIFTIFIKKSQEIEENWTLANFAKAPNVTTLAHAENRRDGKH